MKSSFRVPIFLILVIFNFKKDEIVAPRLPTCISFLKPLPPDSIQTFVKPYLQSKKMKMLEWDEVIRLVGVEINAEAMTQVNSGDLSKRGIEKILDKIDPVSNILSIRVFQNPIDSVNYTIDSIQWQVRYMPARDTIARYKAMYVPEKSTEKNPYLVLKAFLDKVVLSGYLK